MIAASRSHHQTAEAMIKSANAISKMNRHNNVVKVIEATQQYQDANSELQDKSRMISEAMDHMLPADELDEADEQAELMLEKMTEQVGLEITQQMGNAPMGEIYLPSVLLL